MFQPSHQSKFFSSAPVGLGILDSISEANMDMDGSGSRF